MEDARGELVTLHGKATHSFEEGLWGFPAMWELSGSGVFTDDPFFAGE
jgi:hypothetical protein